MRREFRNAGLILAAIVLLIYGQSLVGDTLVGGADVIRSAYPIRLHFWSIVERGELPTWTSYLMGGYPIIVEEQASLFYPLEWIFGLIRSPPGYNLIIAFHVWFAGLGAYILARKLHLSCLAAWIVAVIAIFGAPLTARVAAGHPSHLYGRALMIWALVAILYLAERPGWRSALGLAAVFGAQLLIGIGNYQTALYTAMLSLLFSLFVIRARVSQDLRRSFVLWGLLAIGIAFGVGAVRAGPTIETGLQSSRQTGLSAESLNYGALPPIMLFGYFLPHTFDDPSISDYTWPEFALYVGSVPILLALVAVFKRWREPAVQFWIAVTVLFLVLSLGSPGGLFSLFAKYFPGYQLFRNPARHVMVASLGVMMLAGYGTDTINLKSGVGESALTRWRILIPGIGIGLLALLMAATYEEPIGSSIELLPARLIRGAAWFTVAIAVFYLTLKLIHARSTARLEGLMVAVVVFDLILYAYPQIHQMSKPAELAYVEPKNFAGGLTYSVAFLEKGTPADWGMVNVAAENGVRLLNMYTGVIPMRMARVINILTGRPALAQQEENQILLDSIERTDLLDFFGVRHLLVAPNQDPNTGSMLKASNTLGQLRSFDNTSAMPFAFLMPEFFSGETEDSSLALVERSKDLRMEPVAVEGVVARAEVDCLGSTPASDRVSNLRLKGGNLSFEFEASQPGMLIVNQTFQNGWEGWVNGVSTPVHAVNHRWIGLHLPCSGEYEIDLRFLPIGLKVGLIITFSTLILVATISLVFIVDSRRDELDSNHR
jgi:hypothetical protein